MPLYQHGPFDEALQRRVAEPDVEYSRLIYEDLEDELADYTRYVPAVKSHFGVFSTKLWGIILRACAEIDSQLSNLLDESGEKKGNKNIKDYIAQESILQLSRFRLVTHFGSHELAPFATFASGDAPIWWRDYNSVKHRRLESLHSATLENALDAVGGLQIVLLRQWGDYIFPRRMMVINAEQIAKRPSKLFSVTATSWFRDAA